jgi:pimeloyl-ACP methyl ester carboxylesterase
MHGWGGYCAQLGAFIEPLVTAGFRVALFDALGHGESATSGLGLRQASFLDFAGGLAAIRDALGPLYAVVAHSGGAAAAGIALRRGLSMERLVLLAPVATPGLYAARFERALGVAPEVSELWRTRSENRVGFRFVDLDLTPLARDVAVPRTLLIHDHDDPEVPFAESEEIAGAWPNATLYATDRLGHRRILRDANVIERVTQFVSESRTVDETDFTQPTEA